MADANLDARIAGIKQRIAAIQQQHAQASVQKATAEASVARSIERLRTEYGVETQADGQRVYEQLQQELATAVANTESALERTHT